MKLFIILSLLSFNLFAGFNHSHQSWNSLLKKYVVTKKDYNRFQYKKLKENKKDMSQLKKYLQSLSSVSMKDYEAFTKEQKLAFLINAYNAFTVDVIFTRYPVKSIRDIGFLSLGPWRRENIKLLSKEMSLHQIEKDYLIDKFNAPRIHFAINCASVGCPSIQPFAFTASDLENQFEISAQDFVLNQSKNFYDKKEKKLKLSKIFDWYAYDFDEKYGSVKKYLAPILAKQDKKLEKKIFSSEIEYLDYDWALNE